ncbi:serine hydrolase domain-containing protein [Saccharothrix texasensis]|uniref:D-alanyl-D-alanine carboxypeptidase n=1 Tax=Saccharothrix texasensis TaxID=103734 RepID=A0A3N1HAM6_9PSEU|nr:serine hydrolase domain-containing protein [Saccharothrix texasensis]ROP39521.1 D-alanyl-D-alanine carboxypeptidase [Saccharothrix texasensis]
MRRLLRAAAAGALALSLTATTAGLAAAAPPDRLASAVDRALAAGVPGVVVRVDDGRGRPVEVARQARWTLPDHRLRSDDEFKMASNTKTVSATLVLRLVAERRIGLDDPVGRWLPGVVPNGSAVTLRMLLNQTSGLFDYLDDPRLLGLLTGRQPRPWPPADLVAVAVSHPPLFAPGERWDYSNTNYTLIGMVLEAVTGRPYTDLVERQVLRPLGMGDTYFADGTGFRGRHARGYEPDAEHLGPLLPPGVPVGDGFAGPRRHEHVDVTGIDLGPAWAAGGLISTPADWRRFLTALMSGRLIPRHLLAEMRDAVPQGGSSPHGYGLGVMEVTTSCGTVWGHSGGFPGYRSHNYADAAGDRTVTVLLTTNFALAAPDAAAAQAELVDAAVCRLNGR